MARFGAAGRGGVHRLALSSPDLAARADFRAQCEQAGLRVRVDEYANMFARREGRDPTLPPVVFGSHLDSQPLGGRYDGALGVMAGLEVMRSLNDHGIVTQAPLELVNWTDEEGARWGKSLLGSGLWSGVHGIEATLALRDANGISFGEALVAARGDAPGVAFPGSAYFEMHIEQGVILENAGLPVGIVTGCQAQVWYELVATGLSSHAGTTPPSFRRDALVAAARVIDLVDRMMRARGEEGRGTVGRLQVIPNSSNVIPGEVRFSAEFRHPVDAELARIKAQFPREVGFIARDAGVAITVKPVLELAATPFDPGLLAMMRTAADAMGLGHRDIVSGGGHDAIYAAKHMKAAMIFIPCLDGRSHCEEETIEADHAAAGTALLYGAVRRAAGA
jgi:N-carbamoyl-L-amino-acid hydrolase